MRPRALTILLAVLTSMLALLPRSAPAFVSGLSAASAQTSDDPALYPETHARAANALRAAPLMFVENVGQFDAQVRFHVSVQQGTMHLTQGAIWYTLLQPDNASPRPTEEREGLGQPVEGGRETPRGVNLKVTFVGANPHSEVVAFNQLEAAVSYFIGSEPAKWQSNVPTWGGVRYIDLYPGIDLELTSEYGRLVQRLVGRPGADLDAVRLRIEGPQAVHLSGQRLVLTTDLGQLSLPLLAVEGAVADEQASILHVANTTFEITSPFIRSASSPNHTEQVERPSELVYSTFLGGSNDEPGTGIAVDASGAAYTVSCGYSDFPTTPGAFDTTNNGGWDAVVTKLNPDGSGLVYSTFIGGAGVDCGSGVFVDDNRAVYVTGDTYSSDFPTTAGAFDRTYNGGSRDIFVAKLNPDGTALVYGTYLGGESSDYEVRIAVDISGQASVAGRTYSQDFPTTPGAIDPTFNGGCDVFVTKLNPDGSGLVYGTFLGASGYDYAGGLAVDGAGALYVTGHTDRSEFPTTPGAWDRSVEGANDAFVTKINPDGTELGYSTFLGGTHAEHGQAIALDAWGAVYVAGDTSSSDFPTTAGAFDNTYSGGGQYARDIFVSKLNPTGSGLIYSTFLGGGLDDFAYGIAVDDSHAAYITGQTGSSTFPTTADAFDTTYGGGSQDVFVTKLNPDGTGLDYSTFLGGGGTECGRGIAVDVSHSAYIVGEAHSSTFPTTPGAFDTTYNGGPYDAFVAKLRMGAPPPLDLPFDPAAQTGVCHNSQNGLNCISSYFDHRYPLYDSEGSSNTSTVVVYWGDVITSTTTACRPQQITGEAKVCYSGHPAYDFYLPSGTAVRAAADGYATGTWSGSCGGIVRIDHGNGYSTEYWHLLDDEYRLTTPMTVTAGTRVGSVGQPPSLICGKGYHLHFELRRGDAVVDPYGWTADYEDPWLLNGGLSSSCLWSFGCPTSGLCTPVDGVTVSSSDGNILVSAVPGACSDTTLLHLTLTPDPVAEPSAIPAWHSFAISARDTGGNPVTSFSEPLTIEVGYSDTDIAYLQESTLSLYSWDDLTSEWLPISTLLDLVNDSATATVTHLSLFSLMGQPQYPAPSVAAVTPSSGHNHLDTEITISGTDFLSTPSVRLGPNELAVTFLDSTTLTALVPLAVDPGTYDLTVTNPDAQEATLGSAFVVTEPVMVYLPLLVKNY